MTSPTGKWKKYTMDAVGNLLEVREPDPGSGGGGGGFTPIRVNVGNTAASYTDTQGNVWAADNGYSGGAAGSTTTTITGTPEGAWIFVGRSARQAGQVLPPFRCTMALFPGVHSDWSIFDPNENTFRHVGRLTEQERTLEVFRGWNADEIRNRILSGKNRFEDFL